MTRARQRSSARRSVLVLSALSGLLMTGCVDAITDAVAAGALNFIQTGVMTTLSSTVFGDGGMASESMVMDGMAMSAGGEHDGHDG